MPFSDLYLGIDIGTTSVKSTLVDREMSVIGQHRVEYESHQIRPMWIEQDPWQWWEATCRAVNEVIRLNGISPRQIQAVSVSSQAPSLMGIDGDGRPIGRAMIWMDRRAEQECRDLELSVGETAIRAISGNRIDPYFMLPKLLWEMKQHPEKYERTRQYVQANGWIIFQLTGLYSIDASHAALTQLYNIHKAGWDIPLMAELGISPAKFPDIFGCMDVVGGISAKASQMLGLAEGTPVIAGAIDGSSAPLGLKLYETNQVFEMSGTSSGIGIILDQPVGHPNLTLLKHALEGKWILKGSMSATGGSLRWFRDHVDEAADNPDIYGSYDKLAAASSPGSNGLLYLPYLAGERAPIWDSYAKGVFFGIHLQTGKADMIRSIMEGTAYGLKSILQQIQMADMEVTELFGTGGGYLSAEWSQIKADILETEIKVAYGEIETASLGSAYLALMAATGLKEFSLPDSVIEKTYTPNPSHQKKYREYYSIFNHLYTSNKELFQKLTLAGETD